MENIAHYHDQYSDDIHGDENFPIEGFFWDVLETNIDMKVNLKVH